MAVGTLLLSAAWALAGIAAAAAPAAKPSDKDAARSISAALDKAAQGDSRAVQNIKDILSRCPELGPDLLRGFSLGAKRLGVRELDEAFQRYPGRERCLAGGPQALPGAKPGTVKLLGDPGSMRRLQAAFSRCQDVARRFLAGYADRTETFESAQLLAAFKKYPGTAPCFSQPGAP